MGPQNLGPRAIARFAPPLSRPCVQCIPYTTVYTIHYSVYRTVMYRCASVRRTTASRSYVILTTTYDATITTTYESRVLEDASLYTIDRSVTVIVTLKVMPHY